MKMNWLFLRGLAREQRHWEAFPELFESKIEGQRVWRLDLPGVGTQNQFPSPMSIRGIMENVRARWQALKIDHPELKDGPHGLLAISLGSMVAMDWVDQYPDDFERLVMINGSARGICATYERLNPKRLPEIAKAVASSDLTRRERIVLQMTSNLYIEKDELARKWADYAKERPLNTKVLAQQLFAASRYKVPKSLPVPTLVLGSEGDRFVSSRCSAKLAKHFGAKVRMHTSAGHDLPLDDGNWVADQVGDWLT